MQVPTLLVIPDMSPSPLHLDALSEQALMEIFIYGLHPESQDGFKDTSGSYKDVCKWPGVECGPGRNVKAIRFDKDFPHALGGYLDFSALPPRLEELRISQIHLALLGGTLDTSTLPQRLKSIVIRDEQFNGPVDFRHLPPDLRSIKLKSNGFQGSCHLTALPRRIEAFAVPENDFSGTVILNKLPPKISRLELSENKFYGKLHLCHLPDTLKDLLLNANQFHGRICLNFLPPGLRFLNLANNRLSGELDFTVKRVFYPKVNLYDNALAGTARVHSRAYQHMIFRANHIKAILDEEGRNLGLQDSSFEENMRCGRCTHGHSLLD